MAKAYDQIAGTTMTFKDTYAQTSYTYQNTPEEERLADVGALPSAGGVGKTLYGPTEIGEDAGERTARLAVTPRCGISASTTSVSVQGGAAIPKGPADFPIPSKLAGGA